MSTVTDDTVLAEELARLRRAIEREVENAEVVTFESASGCDFRCPMVPASTLRDILDGRVS